LDVLYVLPPPVLSASEDVISSGDEVIFAWEPVEESIWYSVIVYDSQGWQEIYNGSETDFSTSELEIGLNRVRINTGSSDGKISEFSDSIFVTVEESDKSDASSLGEFVQPLALFAIIAIIMVAVLIFDKGE
jgi:hypothetical protein